MPAKEPFHPKAGAPAIERRKQNGMFQNPPSYPQLGGFHATSDFPSPERPHTLEKGDLTRKGKPI